MLGSKMILAFEITCVLIATAAVTLASVRLLGRSRSYSASLILIGTAGLLALRRRLISW